MSETYRTLAERWGVLLSYEALATVMDRSPDGLRLSLAANRSSWAQRINAAKVRFGRRVHFRTELIAALIDDGTSPSVGGTREIGGSGEATTEEGHAQPHRGPRRDRRSR
jgi:hypothetical protein